MNGGAGVDHPLPSLCQPTCYLHFIGQEFFIEPDKMQNSRVYNCISRPLSMLRRGGCCECTGKEIKRHIRNQTMARPESNGLVL
jgi:hypothetical protein